MAGRSPLGRNTVAIVFGVACGVLSLIGALVVLQPAAPPTLTPEDQGRQAVRDLALVTLTDGGTITPCSSDGTCSTQSFTLPRGTVIRNLNIGSVHSIDGTLRTYPTARVESLDRNAKECTDAEHEWKYAVRPTALTCSFVNVQGVVTAR